MLKKIEKTRTKVGYITAFCHFFIDLELKICYFRSIQKKKSKKKGECCL